MKAYQQENSSFIKERKNAKYKSSDYSCIKDKRLMQNYGIRLTDYQRMYIEQNGQCKICKSFHEVLDVDHCHNSKLVRGLLCQRCNKGLGLFKDNPIFLQSALDYLTHIVI